MAWMPRQKIRCWHVFTSQEFHFERILAYQPSISFLSLKVGCSLFVLRIYSNVE